MSDRDIPLLPKFRPMLYGQSLRLRVDKKGCHARATPTPGESEGKKEMLS